MTYLTTGRSSFSHVPQAETSDVLACFKKKKAHTYGGGIQIHSVHAQQLQMDREYLLQLKHPRNAQVRLEKNKVSPVWGAYRAHLWQGRATTGRGRCVRLLGPRSTAGGPCASSHQSCGRSCGLVREMRNRKSSLRHGRPYGIRAAPGETQWYQLVWSNFVARPLTWILDTLFLLPSFWEDCVKRTPLGFHIVHVVNRCRIRLVSQHVSVFQDFRNGLDWGRLGTLHFPALRLMTQYTIPSSSEHMHLDSLLTVWGIPVIPVCLPLQRVSWEWWPLSCSAPGLWDLPLMWF